MKDDKVYLKHILDSIEKIEKYLSGITKSEFLTNQDMAQDAVVRNLGIMGEAANQVSEKFKNRYSQVEWRKVIGIPSEYNSL